MQSFVQEIEDMMLETSDKQLRMKLPFLGLAGSNKQLSDAQRAR